MSLTPARGATLPAVLEATSRAAAVDDALRFAGHAISYGELAHLTHRCAAAMAATGVRPGDRIAVLSPPCWQHVVLFFAAAELGAVFVGLNPRHRAPEHHYVLDDCEPAVLFAGTTLDGGPSDALVEDLADRHRSVRTVVGLHCGTYPDASFQAFLDRGDPPAELAAVSADADVAIVYTSGSTGRRKGALLSHRGLLASFRGLLEQLPLHGPVNCLDDLPIDHLAGLVERVLPSILTGGHIVLHERFEPAAFLRDAAAHRINYLQGEVTQWLRCVELPEFSALDLSGVQTVLFTGAAAPPALVRRLCERFPAVTTAWGMSETHSAVTVTAPFTAQAYVPGLVGRAVAGAEVRLGPVEGSRRPGGEAGEILVRGPVVIEGYFGLPADALDVDPDGWLHTGDVGAWDRDGNLRLVGRASAMYKSGGYNVYPREVETVLEMHPAVRHSAVVAVPDARYQETGFAYVVLAGATPVGEADLRSHCRTQLATYKVPKRIEIVSELPLLPNGKVDRRALQVAAARAAEAEGPGGRSASCS
jgi:acyl-CoA synthetase (AMP-forming)/AMP-acid ligase II